MSDYGVAVYGSDWYGITYLSDPAAGRRARFLPALFETTKLNVLSTDISADLSEGMVTLDLDLDVSKMSFTARLKTKRTVQPLVDYVAPFLRLIYEDGTEDYEQLGVYVLIPAGAEHWPGRSLEPGDLGGSFTQLEGRDLCWLLAADMSTATTNLAASSNVVTAVKAELTAAGLTRTAIQESTAVTAAAWSWPPGTSRLERINDLLGSIGYYVLVFDRHGIAVSQPYIDLATAEPAVTYTTAAGSRIVPPVTDEPDFTTFCNRVVVIGSDPAQTPIYAIRENNDPLSPGSTVALGMTITRREEDAEIKDQATANARAEELLRNGASFYRPLTIQTLPDPTRNPREVYALDLTNEDGTVADGRWRCSGWELSLDWSDPTMVHYLSRTEAFTVTTP